MLLLLKHKLLCLTVKPQEGGSNPLEVELLQKNCWVQSTYKLG